MSVQINFEIINIFLSGFLSALSRRRGRLPIAIQTSTLLDRIQCASKDMNGT